MPDRPYRPCPHPGCGVLTLNGRCDAHRRDRIWYRDRGSATSQLYDKRWERARLSFLRRHPLCACARCEGKAVAASVVDHIIPHEGDLARFWDEQNWQSMAKPCHDRKTMSETQAKRRGEHALRPSSSPQASPGAPARALHAPEGASPRAGSTQKTQAYSGATQGENPLWDPQEGKESRLGGSERV